MASHDVDKRLTQRRFIHRIEEAQRERQVENLVMAEGFIHLPQRFLRQRQRCLRPIMIVGGGHRGIRLRNVQAFGISRQPARRRMAEQVVNVDFDLMQAQQTADHPGGHQRMAAAIEEVFIQGHFRRHQRLTELLQNQRCNAFVRVAVRRRRGHRRGNGLSRRQCDGNPLPGQEGAELLQQERRRVRREARIGDQLERQRFCLRQPQQQRQLKRRMQRRQQQAFGVNAFQPPLCGQIVAPGHQQLRPLRVRLFSHGLRQQPLPGVALAMLYGQAHQRRRRQAQLQADALRRIRRRHAQLHRLAAGLRGDELGKPRRHRRQQRPRRVVGGQQRARNARDHARAHRR
ncbi:Uncharacterised protein [Serratia marcescens]|nr:Uncharacterised protein [Serratia marcescens]